MKRALLFFLLCFCFFMCSYAETQLLLENVKIEADSSGATINSCKITVQNDTETDVKVTSVVFEAVDPIKKTITQSNVYYSETTVYSNTSKQIPFAEPIRIEGLQSAKEYKLQARAETSAGELVSAQYSFKTGASPTSVIVSGDMHWDLRAVSPIYTVVTFGILPESATAPLTITSSDPDVLRVLPMDEMCEQYTNVVPAAASESFTTTAAKSVEVAVYPISEGKAKITAKTPNGKSKSITIQVTDSLKPKKIVFAQDTPNILYLGETYTFETMLEPENAVTDLTWKSSAKKIATVEADTGLIKPLKEGTVRISVTTDNGKKTASIKCKVVDPEKPVSVSIDGTAPIELAINETMQLHVTLQPEKAKSEIRWKSSKAAIAKVEDGKVIPCKEGTVTISATTYNKKKGTIKVRIYDPCKATGIQINCPEPFTMKVGEKIKLTASLLPENSTSLVAWKSSKSSIAYFDDEGYLVAKKAGKCKITATTSSGKKDTITLQVY